MLRKREREVQIPPLPEVSYRLPQPPIQSALENTELFELRNIILMLESESTPTIEKQLLDYIDKHKLDWYKSQLIYSFLSKKDLFVKSILSRLVLSYSNLQQLVERYQSGDEVSEMLINYLSKNSIYEPRYSNLVRKLLLKHYFHKQIKVNHTFTKLLVYLFKCDPNKAQLVQVVNAHLHQYLQSNQLNITLLFSQLLKIPQFYSSLQQFIHALIKKNTNLEPSFEKYLVQNLIQITNNFPSLDKQQIFQFLCYKMKSLNKQIRKCAILTTKSFPVTAKLASLMIQKDVLEKTGVHRRGILLQMLEDEYKDIRIAAIDFLKKFLLYMNAGEVKQILLYMINDESDEVRAQALKALTVVAKTYAVTRSDLQIILMPLKESSRLLRHLCYKLIEILTIEDEKLFVQFVTKLLKAYKNYKEDKVFLYRVMRKLGNNYPQFIKNNILQLLDIQYLDAVHQPSWKNFMHKARVILISNVFAPNYVQEIQKNRAKLPSYFLSHYQYIKDVQPYAFQQDVLPLEMLPLFSTKNEQNYMSYMKIIRSHKVFWQQLPVNPSTIRQRFFYQLLVIAESLYNMQNILQTSEFEGVYFGAKVIQVFQTVAGIRGRFEEWEMEALDRVCLVLFQYYILGKLNPLQFNKSQASKLSILSAKLISSYVEKYGQSTWLRELQEENKSFMTTLTEPHKHAKQLRAILLNNQVSQHFFDQLENADKMALIQPVFSLQCETVSSPFAQQYTIHCQISSTVSDVSNFRIRITTDASSKVLRILQSDSKELEMEQQHKKLYSIELQSFQFQGKAIKDVEGLKRSRIFGFVEDGQELEVIQGLGLEIPFVVLCTIKL